jgi:peptidoglycan/xylan/chitin deacetylase (PgdA/CDA1 family)
MDENDVKYLYQKGVTIGSHSSSHRLLSQCDGEGLKEEILDNETYIESLTGEQVRHMAIPFGKREHYNDHVLQYCHAVGHDCIYSTNPVYFDRSSLSNGRRLIPRISFLNESREEIWTKTRLILFILSSSCFTVKYG